MWENETVVLLTSLKSRILSGEKRIRFEKIVKDDAIPQFIKDLFKKRVEEFFRSDPPILIQENPYFDLSPEDLGTIRLKLADVFRNKAIFDAETVQDVLREALVIRLDYLVKPIDTMRRLLFDTDSPCSMEEARKRLDPFLKILPYADEFIHACEKNKATKISTSEYGKIADSVLSMAIDSDPVKGIMKDFSVLTEYLSETKGEEVQKIEGSVLQQLLADRNLWGFRRAVEVEMSLGRTDFDISELEMTLKRYLELKKEFSEKRNGFVLEEKAAREKEEKGESPRTIDDEEKTKGEIDDWALEEVLGIDEADEGFTVSEEKMKPEPGPVEKDNNRKQKNTVQDDLAGSVEEGNKPKEGSAFSSSFGLKTLAAVVDEKMKKGFIKKLFNNDGEAYESLMKKLDEAESWRVAKILIDNDLFKHDVDPFSREAIKLVDLVYSRFYPEEGIGGNR